MPADKPIRVSEETIRQLSDLMKAKPFLQTYDATIRYLLATKETTHMETITTLQIEHEFVMEKEATDTINQIIATGKDLFGSDLREAVELIPAKQNPSYDDIQCSILGSDKNSVTVRCEGVLMFDGSITKSLTEKIERMFSSMYEV